MTQVNQQVQHPVLSQRAARTHAQPISWLMQQALEVPGLISLAAGLVDQETLPVQATNQVANEIFADANAGRAALQYGTTEGLPPLRELIAARYLSDTPFNHEHCVLTTGSQQFLELLGEAIYDPGDIVIVEDPTYFVYAGLLDSFGVEIRGVKTDANGMMIDDLQRVLDQLSASGDMQRLKAIYVVSYSQNPGGVSLSAERKQQLMAMIPGLPQRCVVIEDAAYYELSFMPERRPALLASSCTEPERVVTAITFSKPYAPGLKTGVGIVPQAIYTAIHQLKGNHDFGSSNLCQAILTKVVAEGHLDQHIATLRQRYAHKATLLAQALSTHLGDRAEWNQPDGGLYLWVRFPGVDTSPDSSFFAACLQAGVLYVPGSYAYMPESGRDKPSDYCRLTFGMANEDELEEGGRRLAVALDTIATI